MEGNVIYKELSYEVVGAVYEVYNSIGSEHYEKYLQNAIAREFESRKIQYT